MGSSPRARGTLRRENSRLDARRFIPASAGNTLSGCLEPGNHPVHPRERGEHSGLADSAAPDIGSSPRARGTRFGRARLRRRDRFIPASAGNTASWRPASRPAAVHPRERGEHVEIRLNIPHTDGSSPRARGTPPVVPACCGGTRFIPASAGNTVSPRSVPSSWKVHPRERGEHTGTLTASSATSGSSPRARGTRVGSSSGDNVTPVHPRERGEHVRHPEFAQFLAGSSPRARGTRRRHDDPAPLARFIPASAGNT